MVRSGFVPATEASLPTPRKAGTQAQGGGAHLYHIVCMTFCKSLCLSAPMAAVCGIQGPVWPDGGSGPPFMSCHQFAGLSPGHSLASSRLSFPPLNGQLSGLPGFHSKNLAKQTGSGQATEGDSRPKALPRSREPGPECGRTRSPWAPIPDHPRTSASSLDP